MSLNALIVCDETQVIRHLSLPVAPPLAHLLARLGYRVTTVTSSSDAIPHLTPGAFDMLMIDCGLPDLWDFMAQLQARFPVWADGPLAYIVFPPGDYAYSPDTSALSRRGVPDFYPYCGAGRVMHPAEFGASLRCFRQRRAEMTQSASQ